MRHARSLVAVLALAAVMAPRPALAHRVTARLSPGGVEFVEQQLPGLVPSQLSLPEVTAQVADPCPGSTAITWTQRDTTMNLWVDALDLSLPSNGTLRVDLTLTAWAVGEAFIDNPYACIGSATCQDELYLEGARAVVDFDVWIDAGGKPRVTLSNVQLDVDPDKLQFALSDCAIDSLVNLVVDLGKGWAIDMIGAKVQELANNKLAPKLEEMLAGFVAYQGVIGSASFDARLVNLDATSAGVGAAGEIDLRSSYAADACVAANDKGDPSTQPGATPNLLAAGDTHVAVAVNLGLVDDALYHVWREGFLCVTPETLAALGFPIDLSIIGHILPLFPEGTTFGMNAVMTHPPRIQAVSADDVDLTLVIPEVVVNVIATTPDGTKKTLTVTTGARARVGVALDPGRNALAMSMREMHVENFQMQDDWGLTEAGMDADAVAVVVEDLILPQALGQFGELPLLGSVFGAAGYYIIPRDLHTTEGHLVAAADLFHAPENDGNAPDTSIDAAPTGPVGPQAAKLVVSGIDAEVPGELLRYVVSVDGVEREPTWLKEIVVGRAGESGLRRVEVRAMDLAGNVDATPAVVTVQVDGIAPVVSLVDAPRGIVDTAAPTFTFDAQDETTPAERLGAKVTVLELGDGNAAEPAYEEELDPGARGGSLRLEPGKQYRVVITVSDEAGNRAARSATFQVSSDAEPLGGCGCRAGGREGAGGGAGAGAGALAALLGAVLVVRRRRR
jgi:hypothetical protein